MSHVFHEEIANSLEPAIAVEAKAAEVPDLAARRSLVTRLTKIFVGSIWLSVAGASKRARPIGLALLARLVRVRRSRPQQHVGKQVSDPLPAVLALTVTPRIFRRRGPAFPLPRPFDRGFNAECRTLLGGILGSGLFRRIGRCRLSGFGFT